MPILITFLNLEKEGQITDLQDTVMNNLIGKTLGQYQILEEIGRGGMAVVYKAHQPTLERYVAIKVLPQQFTFDREFVERFLREARAAARLNHPNIVTIHDVGQADGTYYIVMEYLEGPSLADLLRQQRALPPQQAAQIVAQVASALDYAHQQGFVHRDVKPSNILLGAGGVAKLTDFGIVKAAEGTRLTQTGTVLGTPEYMSPEQAKGLGVDRHSDIYSLGVVAYEMLAGRVPFSGDTLAVLHAHVYEPPDLRALPVGVQGVVSSALAKDPRQRFGSSGAFAQALERTAAGVPVGRQVVEPPIRVAARPGMVQLRPRPVPGWVWALGAVAVVLIAGIVLALALDGGRAIPAVTPTLHPVVTSTAVPATDTPVPTVTEPPSPTPVPPTETPSLAEREEDLLSTLRYRKGNGGIIFAYQVETPPAIDGQLNEWASHVYDIFYEAYDPEARELRGNLSGPYDLDGRFYIGWDADNLYLGIEITDDAHVQIEGGRYLYKGDDVEIQIDTNLSGDFYDSSLSSDDGQVGFSAGDFSLREPEAYIWRPPDREQAGTMIVLAARETSSGYTLEAAIPWWTLGGRPPDETPVGFCLSLSDNDVPGTAQQQTLISTAPTRKWGDPTTWGTLILVDWR
ncbi:MAG TPA: hypothetical protein ENL34_13545 [Chloroflexi bacterium]|nr:hypothetical protein [Chloroflexota bacterium]